MKISLDLQTVEDIRFLLRQIVDNAYKRRILEALRKAEQEANHEN